MDSPLALSPSPASTFLSHLSGTSPRGHLTVRNGPWPSAPKRSQTLPTPPSNDNEPLTFAKMPISPAPSAPLTVSSTDSEACFSDAPSADLSRSPSLLTSLIQSNRRANASAGASVASSPQNTCGGPGQFATFPRRACGPILRRSSTSGSASEDNARINVGFAAALSSGLVSVREARERADTALPPVDPEPTIARRRSCLKFAVTPRPLQLHPANTASATSSRRTSPRMDTPHLAADDEDEDELRTPGWASDGEDGYQEDSEDGFSSDDDDTCGKRWPWLPRWHAHPNNPYGAPPLAPILAPSGPSTPTPARGARKLALEPVVTTDDGGESRGRRIRIHDDRERRRAKCTRHRSPPPSSVLVAAKAVNTAAPPAARSPSAADLCRRRSGQAKPEGERASFSARTAAKAAIRGWRSDDAGPRLTAAPTCASATVHACTSVKFALAAADVAARAERQRAREGRDDSLVRRGSAPARVDEVHVLADATENRCSRRGLKRVLRSARVV